MHLMYTLDASGKRIYTLKKIQNGEVTKSAHPARFSPDDKYSRSVHIFSENLCASIPDMPGSNFVFATGTG